MAQEATTNTYTIGEQNVFSVGCMVEYMYTGTYNIDICTVGEPPGFSTMRDEDVARRMLHLFPPSLSSPPFPPFLPSNSLE